MEKRTKGCLWIGLGLAIAVGMVAIAVVAGTGYWAYQRFAPSAEFLDQKKADEQMAQILARFTDPTPLIIATPDGHGARARTEGRPPFTGQLESLHVAAYDVGAGKLVRFTVPFWLLRLGKDGKLSIDGHLDDVRGAEKLTVKDLETLGPGLLFDELKPNGDRVLVWTE